MTTISNMNIVVQQSGGAKNAQNLRPVMQEYSQLIAVQQKEKDVQQRTTVQSSEEARQAKLDKDGPDKRRRKYRRRSRSNPAAPEPAAEAAEGAGKLLDTVV